MSFKHLNIVERESIFLWLNQGVSNREIARRLSRDHKCIDKEIENNTKYGRKYSPYLAQKRAGRVGNRQRYKAPLKNPEIFLYVREHLRYPHFWTPEMISGHIGYDIPSASISIETIYQHIYSRQNHNQKLWEYLPCGRKKRQKKHGRRVQNKGKVPNAVSIDLRPKSIGRRKHPGHWETDNIEGERLTKPALSVTVERVVRLTIMTKMPNQKAEEKTKALSRRMKPLPSKLRLSITQDNGKENYKHEETKQLLGTDMYFCHAYHSYEKGAVENRNRVVRRFFPKGTDFTVVSEEDISNVEYIINSMPMKCLRYKTPYEKMQQLMCKLKST